MTPFMTFCDFICIKEKVSEELGQADSENLRGRSPGLPEVQRADADHKGPENKGSVPSGLPEFALIVKR